MKLYELPQAIRDLVDRAVDPETGEIDASMEEALDALQEEFGRKAEYIALLSREAKAEAEAVGLEERRLKARRQAAENREARLKSYLHACLLNAGVDRLECSRVKIRVQANSRPSIQWTGDVAAIPEQYRRVTVELDGTAAYETVKAGGTLPDGFRVETGNHLRVT
jgi:hypothetical protein